MVWRCWCRWHRSGRPVGRVGPTSSSEPLRQRGGPVRICKSLDGTLGGSAPPGAGRVGLGRVCMNPACRCQTPGCVGFVPKILKAYWSDTLAGGSALPVRRFGKLALRVDLTTSSQPGPHRHGHSRHNQWRPDRGVVSRSRSGWGSIVSAVGAVATLPRVAAVLLQWTHCLDTEGAAGVANASSRRLAGLHARPCWLALGCEMVHAGWWAVKTSGGNAARRIKQHDKGCRKQ